MDRTGCYLESHYIYCRSRTLYSLFRCTGLLSTSTLCFSTDLANFFFWVPPCYSVIPDLLCTCIYQAVAHTQSHNFSLHCFFFLLCMFTSIPHCLAQGADD